MFGFNSRQIEKEINLPFQVILELKEDGTFLAKIPHLPGCTARGRTKSEALRHVSETARHHLDSVAKGRFDRVWEDPSHHTLNAISAFFGRVVAGSNRDGCFSSASGDFGTWVLNPVSKQGGSRKGGNGNGNGAAHEELDEGELDLVDYSPQVYCYEGFSGGGAPRLYAGTSAHGSIYESVDGLNWELAYATGEARVHCMSVFKDRLYAGTSASGKLFCYTGTHWSLVHRTSETAITALGSFKGEFFMGTYPGGQIYASPDGVHWHLACDTEQTFVRAFKEYNGKLYAATSKAAGGIVFRTSDGVKWEKVFETRDPNFYCLTEFHHSLWLGTGNHGRLYRSKDGDRWELADTLDEEGIRGMDSFEGRLYLATEGKGRIYRSSFADTLPPNLGEIRITDITSHSAVIEWRTDRRADSLVRFGETGEFQASVHRHELVTDHKVALPYLKALTDYEFQVFSKCDDGSETAFTQRLKFTTAAAETAAVKSTTHPDPGKWYNSGTAVLSWNAPEGIHRFHYLLDQVPDTIPVPGGRGVITTGEHSARYQDLDDGVWYFHLVAQDRAGNLGTQASHFKFQVDTVAEAPVLQSDTHPVNGAWSNKASAEFRWEAPSDLSGIAGYYTLFDRRKNVIPTAATGTWTEEPALSVEMDDDGDWYLHVISVDKAGNVGAKAAQYHLRLDRRADPPAVASTSHPDPTLWVNSSNLEVAWSPPVDASGVAGYYTVLDQRPETVPTEHSGNFTTATQASYQAKADGVWYFHIVTVDKAGNVGREAAHYPFRVDTWAAAPGLASPSHPQGVWRPLNEVEVEITPPEDLSGIVGYYYVLDRDRGTVPGSSKGTLIKENSLSIKDLADGLWYLHVVSKDAAGNVGEEAAHYAIRVDTQVGAPKVNSTSHPAEDNWSRLGQADFVWEPPEDLSGIARYFYILDQSPDTVPTAHSGSKTVENRCRVTVPEDGIWHFHVVAQDRAGNVGEEAGHYKIRVDTKALAPHLSCPTHPERGAWSNHVKPRFEWAEPEDSSGIVGYYYLLDRVEDTIPTSANGFYTTERYAVIDRGLDGDGAWYFHVVARDAAGNVGTEAAHYPLHIDTTANPPVLHSSSHADRHAWSNDNSPVFDWEAPEDDSGIVGYYYLLNHSSEAVPNESTGTWTEEKRVSFAGLEDGVWTLHVVSKDRCGNVGSRASHYTVRIDTKALPPKVASPTHAEDTWARNANPQFTWTAPKDLSGVAGYYYLVDQEPTTVPTKDSGRFTTGSSATVNNLEDGLWIFHIVTLDQAGNMGSQAAHYAVHVDTVAKTAKISSSTHPSEDEWHANASPVLSWQAPDEPSGVTGYYYAVDQSENTIPGPQSTFVNSNQVKLPQLPDGEWFFHLVTEDGAGNLSDEAAHYRLKVDTNAPAPRAQSSSHPSNEDWYGNTKPTFVWDDGEDLSGIVGHYWIFDQQPNTQVQPSSAKYTTGDRVTMPPQTDGVWYFHLAARDKAGNLSPTSHVVVRIETVPPRSKLEGLPAVSGRSTFEVRWEGTDTVSGVASFDVQSKEDEDGEWTDWLSGTPQRSSIFKGTDARRYFFRVRGRDHAGNLETWDDKGPWPSTVVDLTPPTPIDKLVAKAGPAGSVLLMWGESRDPISGVAFYRVYRSTTSGVNGQLISEDKAVVRCGFKDSGKELSDGALYYYTVKAVDKAGNECVDGNAQVACVSDQSAKAPVLQSPSHPVPLDWYQDRNALVQWEEPPDSTGMDGYYWILDQNPNTVPDDKSGKFQNTRSLEARDLKDGTWYVHVVSKDKAGNLSSEAAHFPINIDTTPPPAPEPQSSTHPDPQGWSAENNAAFHWSLPPDPAGIAGYYWVLDHSPETMPQPEHSRWTTSASAQCPELEDGAWYFHVLAKDKAGNLGQKAGHRRVQIARTAPPPQVRSTTHPDPGQSYPSRTASFEWETPPFDPPIEAFHFVLDKEKDTVPDSKDARSSDGRAEFFDLVDGDWFFHVVSVDANGKAGKFATHFPVHIRSAGSLQGQVTRPNGILPAEGALVSLFQDGEEKAKATTDREGRFRFHNLPLGNYSVQVAVEGSPALLVDGLILEQGLMTLALSLEVCATPNPSAGADSVRFFVLAKEAGDLAIQLYTESGKTVERLHSQAEQAGYVSMDWAVMDKEPGVYLYQAVLRNAEGRFTKYPIRKLQITER